MQNLAKSIAIVALSTSGVLLTACKQDVGMPRATDVPADQLQKQSYAIGRNMAKGLQQSEIEIDQAYFNAGFYDVFDDVQRLTDEESAAVLAALSEDVRLKQQAKQEEQQAEQAQASIENLEKANEFLASNASEEGVVTLDSGMQYKVLVAADGAKPVATDQVTVNYEGRLTDGTVFDSSYERGKPATFPLNGVIKGWTEALQLMSPGAKWQLFIPPQLAYGERAVGDKIEANSALIFDVELLSIGESAAPE